MPPNGLWSVPRHHLYGGKMNRRHSFNSNEFASQTKPEPTEQFVDTAKFTDGAFEPQHGESLRKDKKLKRHSVGNAVSGGKDAVATPDNSKSNTKQKQRKVDAKKHSKREDPEKPRSSKSKRKRDSDAAALHMSLRNDLTPGKFPLGNDFADSVLAVVKGSDAPVHPLTEVASDSEKPKKKQRKECKSEANTMKVETLVSLKKQRKKPRKSTGHEASTVDSQTLVSLKRTPIPAPGSKKTLVPAASIEKTPKKTPIPPPQLFVSSGPLDVINDPYILIPETPHSRTSGKVSSFSNTPVPFKLPEKSGVSIGARSSSKDASTLVSTPTTFASAATLNSTLASSIKSRDCVPLPSVPNALTDANLDMHTHRQSEKSKSKPGFESATPTVSTNTKDMFTRSENYTEEHPAKSFQKNFLALQSLIVFSKEHKYLKDHLTWDSENESVPACLGNATGCNAKKEELLRLGNAKMIECEGGDPNTITEAGHRVYNAEELLILSICAKIPVPVGDLSGTWTLCCPKYAETHFDKYGYGQRTLVVSPIAGQNNKNMYTARLNIPPRPMTYMILPFETPPHASFRTVTIRTAAEGYEMGAVFLGNGYLLMRVDLKLLLKGKASQDVQGKKRILEFVGVHEAAVHWGQMEGEKEKNGDGNE